MNSNALEGSNPFCTRFTRPDVVDYRFHDNDLTIDSADQLCDIAAAVIKTPLALIVGPHGTGKTTLLHSLRPLLAQHFTDIATVQLHGRDENTSRWRSAQTNARICQQSIQQDNSVGQDNSALLIVDGLEQLLPWQRFQFVRRARKNQLWILATSHRDIRSFRTLHRTSASRQNIQQLANELLQNSPPQLRSWIRTEINNRQISRDTNVRELWFDLYDVCAQTELHPN